MTANRCPARGALDMVVRLDDRLRIGGWATALAPVRFASATVAIAGVERDILDSAWGVTSPDIAQLFPRLHAAATCRFFVDVALAAEERLDNACVRVNPRGPAGELGPSLFQVVAPWIVMPTADDVLAVGGGEFGGLEFLGHFVDLAGLEPGHDVLDIGCGIGRMAYPLSFFVADESSYTGFDIVAASIDGARARFRRFERFAFVHADLANGMYNPDGDRSACQYRFPVEDGTVDFAFATSLFTHIDGATTRHYLAETRRALRSTGAGLLTFFLLDDEARALVDAGPRTHAFRNRFDDGYANDLDSPEAAIGYERSTVESWIASAGMRVDAWHRGSWSGFDSPTSYQDVLVVRPK
ncbi:MAG: methyltransferase domain-containing protein [Planctomycetes bacterium]|nr:methyltransferase domain-containing protein [Planctomycetota bacterium]MCB9889112.1 methyltransferase domain-containing protein [Planctomycetota bacterium]